MPAVIFCFCITIYHGKPRNCIFSLKCCMLFCQQTQNIHITSYWSQLNTVPITIHCMHQRGSSKGSWHSICYPHDPCLLSLSQCWLTQSLYGSCLSSSLVCKSLASIVVISCLQYLTVSAYDICCQAHCVWQFCLSAKQCIGALCVQYSPTAVAWNSGFTFCWVQPSDGPVPVQKPTDYTI